MKVSALRILYLFALGFAAACGGWLYVGISVSLWWIPLLISIACLPVLLYFRHRAYALAGVLLFGCGIGLLRCNFAAPPPLSALSEGDVTITCRDYSWENTYGVACEGQMEIGGKHVYIRIYLKDTVFLEPGDEISGSFRFSESSIAQRAKSIYYIASQNGSVEVHKTESKSFSYLGVRLRHACETVLRSVLPPNAQPFALGLLLGENYELDHATDIHLRIAGVRHMVAVSGMHISILFLLLSIVSGKQRWILASIGIPVMLLFSWMVGSTPSVIRAVTVQGIFLLALLTDKRFDGLTAIGIAGLLLLIRNPYTFLSVGFQLSFAGALGIALFSEKIAVFLQERIPEKLGYRIRRMLEAIVFTASITLGASVLTIPLTAIYFDSISLISVVSNLVLAPMMTVLFYGLLASALAGVIWFPLGKLLGIVIGCGVELFLWMVEKLAAIPYASVYTNSIYITLWLVISYLICAFLFRRKMVLPAIGISVVLLAAAVGISVWEPKGRECEITVLDVGQGQCVLLQSKDTAVLVDCGGSDPETAGDLAAETLISRGIYRLDALIVSHIDYDHSGGVPYLLERVGTESVYLPDYGDNKEFLEGLDGKQDTVLLSEDEKLEYLSCTVSIFSNPQAKTSNESSLCVLFQTENCDILITGDLTKDGERMLLDRVSLPKLELLVAGHHGADNATSEELLEETEPEIAVISVGENDYGHPNEKTLERLFGAGCEVFRTDEAGTIIFRR